MTKSNKKKILSSLKRRLVAKTILAARKDLLIVTGLGSTTWDFAAAGDRDLTFPLWGAMGSAAPIGLGLALSRAENRILVVTGDGEMLMGLGTLATIATLNPKNLTICVFDNGHYAETGMQQTATFFKTDLALTAKGLGIKNSGTIHNISQLNAQLPNIVETPGPIFRAIKIKAEIPPFVLPPKDGAKLKSRFRKALFSTYGKK